MLRKLIKGVLEIRNQSSDAKLGRKLVGLDRNGNKYYQYYDRDGYEGKREV
jgi:hypothetical protein